MFRKSSRWAGGRADAHDVDGHTEFTSVPFREELVTPKPYPRFRVSGGASRTFGERDPRGKTSGLGKKKPFFSYLKMRSVATRVPNLRQRGTAFGKGVCGLDLARLTFGTVYYSNWL